MKTIYLSLVAAVALLLSSCGSSNSMLQGKDLPVAAQDFIAAYFPNATVQGAQKDPEIEGAVYKVKLDNGFALEFDKDGMWRQVNGTPQSIPDVLIPATISEYVDLNFPEQTILILEQDKQHYKIFMLNDVELSFDKQGNPLP